MKKTGSKVFDWGTSMTYHTNIYWIIILTGCEWNALVPLFDHHHKPQYINWAVLLSSLYWCYVGPDAGDADADGSGADTGEDDDGVGGVKFDSAADVVAVAGGVVVDTGVAFMRSCSSLRRTSRLRRDGSDTQSNTHTHTHTHTQFMCKSISICIKMTIFLISSFPFLKCGWACPK